MKTRIAIASYIIGAILTFGHAINHAALIAEAKIEGAFIIAMFWPFYWIEYFWRLQRP